MNTTPDPNSTVYPNTYENEAKGIRIFPGHWRPHYVWEHIAWISPPWPSQDYIWLDFPEAVFTNQGLIYLSHINPQVESVYRHLPPLTWAVSDNGLFYERHLPNQIALSGHIWKRQENIVGLELTIRNHSSKTLADISLQTCAFLRAIREFADYTRDNKLVHTEKEGWVSLSHAMDMADEDAPYRVGWRTRGKRVADKPVIATISNRAKRFLAFTWGIHTLSLIGNPNHPCAHADPFFPEIPPGEKYSIGGLIGFFEGDPFNWPCDEFVKQIR